MLQFTLTIPNPFIRPKSRLQNLWLNQATYSKFRHSLNRLSKWRKNQKSYLWPIGKSWAHASVKAQRKLCSIRKWQKGHSKRPKEVQKPTLRAIRTPPPHSPLVTVRTYLWMRRARKIKSKYWTRLVLIRLGLLQQTNQTRVNRKETRRTKRSNVKLKNKKRPKSLLDKNRKMNNLLLRMANFSMTLTTRLEMTMMFLFSIWRKRKVSLKIQKLKSQLSLKRHLVSLSKR